MTFKSKAEKPKKLAKKGLNFIILECDYLFLYALNAQTYFKQPKFHRPLISYFQKLRGTMKPSRKIVFVPSSICMKYGAQIYSTAYSFLSSEFDGNFGAPGTMELNPRLSN